MDVARLCLYGSVLGGVRHDGRNRREGGSTSLPASVRAVAGGASVVPVRPPRYPRDCGAQRGRHTGCPGIVSRAWCPGPVVSAREPDPRSPLGAVAPAPVLYALE